MRIWSLHPRYLDSSGLVALWRESLMARKVLEGKTRGYTNHPQLIRFRSTGNSLPAINAYLREVWTEADKRGYHFDFRKLSPQAEIVKIEVHNRQLQYEWFHLLDKLKNRNEKKYKEVQAERRIETHPLFRVVEGEIEPWEKNPVHYPLVTGNGKY